MDFPQMKTQLRSMLTPHRYDHSVGVMETATAMANRFGASVEKARIAGLLHDCAKDYPLDRMLSLCRRLQVPLDDEIRALPPDQQPSLIHAELGASLAKAMFGVVDDEILNAIHYHTLGRPGMTKLEKIVYLADGIEPTRKPYEGLERLRETCFRDLDEAMLLSLTYTIDHNRAVGRRLHSQTVMTKRYFEAARRQLCEA